MNIVADNPNWDWPEQKRQNETMRATGYIILGVIILIGGWIFLRAKKKPKRKRTTRRRASSKTAQSTKRTKGKKRSSGNSRIKKEAGLTTAKAYKDMNARQKQLYNLAKARLARKK